MSRRRQFLLTIVALLAAPVIPLAQSARARRIAVLSGATEKIFATPRKNFELALAKLGWDPGRSLSIKYEFTGGPLASAASVRDLVSANEVLIVVGGASNRTLKAAVTSIPVVTLFSEDPVAAGFAKTLAKPGGNMTGIAYPIGDDWDLPKQLELCREAFPQLRRLGVLTGAGGAAHWRGTPAAIGKRFGIELRVLEASDLNGIRQAVNAFTTATEAVWVELQPNWPVVEEIAELFEKAKLPSISDVTEFVEAGGLLAYGVGVNLAEVMQQMARFVDQLLRGRRAGELPIESPPAAKLVVNARAARAIGYAIPPIIRLRADRVIE